VLIFRTYILACHLQIDADPDPVPDPAYHFDADPDADRDLDFYLMRMQIRMRIQVTKMMRIYVHADPDPQHWLVPISVQSFAIMKTTLRWPVFRIRICMYLKWSGSRKKID
jgi:hypothetical protein